MKNKKGHITGFKVAVQHRLEEFVSNRRLKRKCPCCLYLPTGLTYTDRTGKQGHKVLMETMAFPVKATSSSILV